MQTHGFMLHQQATGSGCVPKRHREHFILDCCTAFPSFFKKRKRLLHPHHQLRNFHIVCNTLQRLLFFVAESLLPTASQRCSAPHRTNHERQLLYIQNSLDNFFSIVHKLLQLYVPLISTRGLLGKTLTARFHRTFDAQKLILHT